MLPDLCPICGGAKSHDTVSVGPLRGRIYVCGAGLCTDHAGQIHQAIVCPKTLDVLARLRADNVRLGDRNVLLATELQAIADAAEAELGSWLPIVIERLPYGLTFARTVYDLAIEALAGEPRPSAVSGVVGGTASGEPGQGSTDLEQVQAAEHAHSGGVS